MNSHQQIFLTFSGAGGGELDSAMFSSENLKNVLFLSITLPCWRWHLAADRTLEDLMIFLDTQVEQAVPAGPFSLAGVSLGGHLAYAIGQRCIARGRTIMGICMVDSFFGGPPVSPWIRLKKELCRAVVEKRMISWLLQHGVRRIMSLWKRFRLRSWTKHAKSGTEPWDLTDGSLIAHELSMKLLISITRNLVTTSPKPVVPIHVRSLVLRTADNAFQDTIWAQRCAVLTIGALPGDHHSISSPSTFKVIGKEFAEWINKAI